MTARLESRTIKLKSIHDAVAPIRSGSEVAIGGSYNRRHPMALVHELIRQQKTDLVLKGWNNGIDYDLLIAAGLVREAHSSYVGMANLGLAKNFRRACQERRIRYVDHTETTAQERFLAASKGLTFAVSKVPLHTALMEQADYQKTISCPFTGERYVALQAWTPDYALIHASRADEYGNIQFDAVRMMENEPDIFIAKSAKKLIVSVEEIVDTEVIMKSKFQTLLPGFLVESVCLAPLGAHPNSCDARYDFDLKHGEYYQACCATDEGSRQYIEEFVMAPGDWQDYLAKVAIQREGK